MLDDAGLNHVRIVVSGGLDEYQIAALVAAEAQIDVFACGTNIVAPADAPTLDSAYKMVAYDGRPVRKLSVGKASVGHRKQVWRNDHRDLITRFDDPPPVDAEPLLQPMLESGQRTAQGRASLGAIRSRASSGRGPQEVVIDSSLLD